MTFPYLSRSRNATRAGRVALASSSFAALAIISWLRGWPFSWLLSWLVVRVAWAS